MEKASSPPLNPAALPPGTHVGPWRVVEWAGHGMHSAVYRAVPVDKEHASAVALKLALVAGDPRFARDEELLARLRHPSVPRLWDAGEWLHPRGVRHPYVVMEWIDGLPLYAWAEQHRPSARQVLRWLSQLARALQALHASGAVHRDVKGANILVSRSEGRAVLVDFGSGVYPEAATLTPAGQFVGTPAYRAPESALFELQSLRNPSARCSAQPAEDLYALGVTACRLVTGEYPEFAEPWKDEQGQWHLESLQLPEALVQVEPLLRTVIERLLSVRPEDRGTAAQLAEELEQAVRETPPASASSSEAGSPRPAAVPIESPQPFAQPSSPSPGTTAPISFPPGNSLWRPPLAAGALLLGVVVGAVWAVSNLEFRGAPSGEHEGVGEGSADAGTAGLGELASVEMKNPQPSAASELPAQEAPPEPQPGQTRPDAHGRCPRKQQVALNGGCWVELDIERCEALNPNLHLKSQSYKGMCYVPVVPPARSPTSTPSSSQ